MRLKIYTILLLIPFLCNAEEMTGKQVMKRQEKLQEVSDEYGEEIMLLVDGASKRKEKRIVRRYNKEIDENEDRSLVVFRAPADVKGTALLTWTKDEGDDDQWLYMPARKKMQRIAQGSKKNYFMGTDYTYEDMEPEDIDNFNYTILRSEKFELKGEGSKDVWVIESVPANEDKRKESGYSKRILWIEKERFITLKVEFYDQRSKLLKTQTNMQFTNVIRTAWRAQKTMMDNYSKNHKTLSLVKKRKIEKGIDTNVMSERYITSEKHMR